MAASYSVALGRPTSTQHSAAPPETSPRFAWHLLLLLLTSSMLLVHGYHPFAEDGGLYLAGVEYRIDPTLFPHLTPFVTAHLRYSVFASGLAACVQLTHLPLTWVLLAFYLFSLWLTLYAALRLLERCKLHPLARLSGLALLAAWATMPVAGTSLLLIDPYLTARSLSTPLSLLAMAFALDCWPAEWPPVWPVGTPILQPRSFPAPLQSLLACLLCLLLAALIHPLMATYAAAMVIALRVARSASWVRQASALAPVVIVAAAVVHALAPHESSAVVQASLSRYYWFLSQWQWYELCGLAGPFLVLTLLLLWETPQTSDTTAHLCRASLLAGSVAVLVNLLFAHQEARTHLIARLQPLRVFLLLYAVMTLLLAATLTQRLIQYLSQRRTESRLSLRLCALLLLPVFLLNAGILFAAQRATFHASQHLELPWTRPSNPWSQAFLWVRSNTPKDALFALDADYISQSGEDAQTFRSAAQRSALPDLSKDGGEASITPSLAQLWQTGVTAQTNLSGLDDPTRNARLLPLGVTWMLLRSSAATQHPCPYDNHTVKVCRLNL